MDYKWTSICACGCGREVDFRIRVPERRFNGPDVVKAKILRRMGWTTRRLAKKFGISQAWMSNLDSGFFDYRIEEWKSGIRNDELAQRRAMVLRSDCAQRMFEEGLELKNLRVVRKKIKEIRSWLKTKN